MTEVIELNRADARLLLQFIYRLENGQDYEEALLGFKYNPVIPLENRVSGTIETEYSDNGGYDDDEDDYEDN